MTHDEFISELRAAGYERQWSVSAVYDSGVCGAGRIALYSRQSHAVVVQDCGEFGHVVFEQSTSAAVLRVLAADQKEMREYFAARKIEEECDREVVIYQSGLRG